MTASCERQSLLWPAVSITTGAGFDGYAALPQRAKHHLWVGGVPGSLARGLRGLVSVLKADELGP
jgi:hypothetical protein